MKITVRVSSRKDSAGDWVVKLYRDGVHYAPADYFTPDKQDAVDSAKHMQTAAEAMYAPKRNPGNHSDVRSPTSTRTEVRSPTSTRTATRAHTQGNVTVTGGAGDGNTSVTLRRNPARKSALRGVWVLVTELNGHQSNTICIGKADAERRYNEFMRKHPNASAWILAPLRTKKNPRRAKENTEQRIYVEIQAPNETSWTTLPSAVYNVDNRRKAISLAKRIAFVGRKSKIKSRVRIK